MPLLRCQRCDTPNLHSVMYENGMAELVCQHGHTSNVELIDMSRLDRRVLNLVTKETVVPKFSWTERPVEGIPSQVEWYDENGVLIATEDVEL